MKARRYVRFARFSAALVAGTLLAACSLWKPPASIPGRTYILDARPSITTPAATARGVLVLTLPIAYAGFDTPQIAYVERPYGLDYYTTSRWVDTPARMLLPLMLRTLEESGRFQAVVSAPPAAPGQWLLNTQLLTLEQRFTEHPSRARLVLRAELLDSSSGTLLGTRVFSAVVQAPSEDAYGGVLAANQAVEQVLAQLVQFVIATVR